MSEKHEASRRRFIQRAGAGSAAAAAAAFGFSAESVEAADLKFDAGLFPGRPEEARRAHQVPAIAEVKERSPWH
jgi:hypothetical protein